MFYAVVIGVLNVVGSCHIKRGYWVSQFVLFVAKVILVPVSVLFAPVEDQICLSASSGVGVL